MSVETYVPSQMSCSISGYELSGWNSITITRNSPVFRQIRGIRGKNTRVNIKDTSAVLSFDVYQSGIANAVFSTALNADNMSASVRLEILLTSPGNGIVMLNTSTAYILGYPEVVVNGELNVNRWQIACEDSFMDIQGTKPITPGLVENGISKLQTYAEDAMQKANNFINR